MAKTDLTADRLRELLHYDPDTGVFTRRVATAPCVRIGDIAGCFDNSNGYLKIGVDGRQRYAHRLAWLYANGTFPVFDIDHLNGIRTDNTLLNLRDVPRKQNIENVKIARTTNKLGVLGVFLLVNSSPRGSRPAASTTTWDTSPRPSLHMPLLTLRRSDCSMWAVRSDITD